MKAVSWLGLVFAALFGGSVLGFSLYMLVAGPQPSQRMIGLEALLLGGTGGAVVAVIVSVVLAQKWTDTQRMKATVFTTIGTVALIGAIILLGNAGVLAW